MPAPRGGCDWPGAVREADKLLSKGQRPERDIGIDAVWRPLRGQHEEYESDRLEQDRHTDPMQVCARGAQDPVAPYHRRVRHGCAKQKVEGNAGPAWQVVDESFQLAAVPLAPRPGIEEQEALHRDGLQRRNFHVAAASPQRAVNATDAIQPAL